MVDPFALAAKRMEQEEQKKSEVKKRWDLQTYAAVFNLVKKRRN